MPDDDGYPTDEELNEIIAWSPGGAWAGKEPWLPILDLVAAAWDTDYGASRVDGKVWTFITGGWSGNEDVLHALSQNFSAWSLLWLASYRGGKHEFGVRDD